MTMPGSLGEMSLVSPSEWLQTEPLGTEVQERNSPGAKSPVAIGSALPTPGSSRPRPSRLCSQVAPQRGVSLGLSLGLRGSDLGPQH